MKVLGSDQTQFSHTPAPILLSDGVKEGFVFKLKSFLNLKVFPMANSDDVCTDHHKLVLSKHPCQLPQLPAPGSLETLWI